MRESIDFLFLKSMKNLSQLFYFEKSKPNQQDILLEESECE